jgi:hypothetical protein
MDADGQPTGRGQPFDRREAVLEPGVRLELAGLVRGDDAISQQPPGLRLDEIAETRIVERGGVGRDEPGGVLVEHALG